MENISESLGKGITCIVREYESWYMGLLTVSIFGLVLNALSIAALLQQPNGQTLHSKLIISLGVSDSFIDIFYVFVLVDVICEIPPEHVCIFSAAKKGLEVALFATLLNVLGMGFDHYLAIVKPLHYHGIRSKFRANLMILLIWILSIIGTLSDIIAGVASDNGLSSTSFCVHVASDDFDARVVPYSLVIFDFFVLIFLYARVFLEYKKFIARRQTFHSGELHNMKAVVTTVLIIGTFLICWMPISVYWFLQYFKLIVWEYDMQLLTLCLMLSNTLCDPIIYASRHPTVQEGYKIMFRKLSMMCDSDNLNTLDMELHI